ncbi:MAG TPA: SMP-30/gluconolactonase/LRE family protein [Smithellaceae bacterium]|nr:SMP-30/gluconolactonase/LRE family protein [Smithellaceae bacterium]HRS83733.1 SMP-30/gluconolactonase/LRE family protein [Smithellaceae bacterium]HRV45220.1 SMP-30/gluconolactonase/LRE family protein [Smithellaceae bacterium]
MKIDIQQIRTIGGGLTRPEGVMALDDGSVRTADAHGRCARIDPDGRTTFFGRLGGLPNGICIDPDGNCIVANIGNGEVQSLSSDGRHTVLMTQAQGKRMSTPNFPFLDFAGRLWVSNSTDNPDIEASLKAPVPDGCLVLIAKGRAPRIVAQGICFANGVALDADEKYVYVAETMKRRILRYRIHPDDTVGPAEVYGPDFLGKFGFPDGIAFDEAGNLWVAFPMANALGYIDPGGALEIFAQDPQGAVLNHPANICFGGKDRRTAFIGSLGGANVPFFEVPHPGLRLVHQKKTEG